MTEYFFALQHDFLKSYFHCKLTMITFSIYHPRNISSIPEITAHHFSTEAKKKSQERIDISNYVNFNAQVINHKMRFDIITHNQPNLKHNHVTK